MDSSADGLANPESLSFEDAYQELEATVRRLEEGGLTIDELAALFERGMALVKLCNARLDAAELRISQLITAPDGSVEVRPFEC